MDNIDVVYPFKDSKIFFGGSKVADYLYDYLSTIHAQTCVVENNYIDRDYLIDYSKFYARSFDVTEKFTTRLHFFSKIFDNSQFNAILNNGDDNDLSDLQKSYLGFIVVKPITDAFGNNLIGKTILATYPSDVGAEKRVFLNGDYSCSLFGLPFNIRSLPFQTQDRAVGACATIACWIALHPLSKLFGTQISSPYEVTERSVSFPSLYRRFPSSGLNIYQMKNYFDSVGLETEYIVPKFFKYNSAVVSDVVKAYIGMGVPVIATLSLKKEGQSSNDHHAVVISGYRHNNGKITELYVHDDQIGPYSRVMPVETFDRWENEWIRSYGYSEITVEELLIPLYPKVRLAFDQVYPAYMDANYKVALFNKSIGQNDPKCGMVAELLLRDVKKYKEYLAKKTFKNKIEVLSKPLPRYLWIIRSQYLGTPVLDNIYDATSVNASHCLLNVVYSQSK